MSQVFQLDELGSKKAQALKIDPNKREQTFIQGELSQSSSIFRIRAKQSSDLYFKLGDLRTDLDLYLYRSNPIEKPKTRAFASGSRRGIEDDGAFTMLSADENIYAEIRKNPPVSHQDNLSFCLQIRAYPTGSNPNLTLPNDPLFEKQWHLFNATYSDQTSGSSSNLNFDIGAPESWFFTTGSKEIPVAIIDTGIDNKHPDLINNLWVNEAERDGMKNIDDDQNGYIDDIHGWDFFDPGRNPLSWAPAFTGAGQANGDVRKSQTEITRSHGTHVAGIIGAEGNNSIGTSGINWNASLMALNAASDQNMFHDNDVVDAMHYAINNGAKIINMSLGSVAKTSPEDFKKRGAYNDFLDETRSQYRKVFRKAAKKDVLIVMAAGNNGQLSAETQGWKNIGDLDQSSHSIHSHAKRKHLQNVLLVGSVDPDRRISTYSSHGQRVDIAAPGGNKYKPIFETDPITGQLTSMRTADYGIVSTVLSDRANSLERSLGIATGNGLYRSENGTSMAAPMVSGSAALIWGVNPSLRAEDVKRILLKSANKLDSLKPFIKGGKSLNLYNAMLTANGYDIDTVTESLPLCVPEII